MSWREKVLLGRTGLQVSRLGVSAGYGVPAYALEQAFHEHGINYFYWGSLRRKGMKEALRHLVQTQRDQLVILLQSYDHSGLITKRSFERGLRTLGLDHADVLLLGWYNRFPRARVLKAALALQAEGKVRHLALSGHRRAMFRELLELDRSPIDIFMIRYNAAHRGAEREVFPFLRPGEPTQPGVTCYTATRWGQLLKPRRMPPDERPLTAAECYRFVLSHPAVDLCMTGPASAQQLTEGLQALDQGPLTEEEMARVRRIGDFVHG